MPLLDGKTADERGPRAFVCRNYACQTPSRSVEELTAELDN